MPKKNSIAGRRAWDILRLALLWARKGSVFRNRVVVRLNVFHKGIRKLRNSNRGALVYGDRELSFDDTPSPVIHVKMSRPSSMRFKMPHIPCINPPVDFDYDFEFDEEEACFGGTSFLKGADDDEEREENEGSFDDEGIDMKAEEFIAKFYEQMKLQRQISYLQYNDKGST